MSLLQLHYMINATILVYVCYVGSKCHKYLRNVLFCQAILGNKYGYRPIPSQIPQTEFDLLESVAKADADVRWSTVEEWYRLDNNNIPSVYILQPISQMIPHYNDNVS